ncbi:xyloglucanase [Paenibacillus zeisoli]|uniref:Xyloglucanase n=1 Tax=Paenibacillus zeisoli TaxID=2496267 RepID=A0A3S1B6V4_9BACL|nr:xyloglucanase [Paenibacillus zeisoli]RUT30544.1 xyloglucanase [Paenibacillus zeisoli]
MFKKVLSLAITAAVALPIMGGSPSDAQAKESQPAVKSQAYDWGRAKVVGGGFIPGIVYNTKEKDLIYARTDMGGAYRWNPATGSWVQLLDSVSFKEWNMLGVESLATDPVDPNRLYVASGTYTNDWTDMNGVLLRSTDRGNTWKRTELPFKLGGNMPGRSMGERLAVDPNNNRVIYLGTRSGNGLWRSTDYGATWNKVASFTAVGNVKDYYNDQVGVVWVTFDPSTGSRGNNTQTIYVGVADTEHSIYRSMDGGKTWEVLPGQPEQGFLPHHGVLSSNGNLYVTYTKEVGPYNGGEGSVWKYNTTTGKWTDISPTGAGATDSPYGGLAVDAQHPDTLMVATMNKWWPDEFIYRSTDGGQTWKSFWTLDYSKDPSRQNNYTIDYSAAPWLDWGEKKNLPEQNPKLGWMIGDLEIDPFNSDRIMYGTGATLYGSNNVSELDKGQNVNISVMAEGIEETAILGLISPPSGAPLLSAMGDIGGFRHEDLTKAPSMITNPTLGTSTDIDYAELNPDIVVRVGNASGEAPRMGTSTDNGRTWKPAANAWPAAKEDETGGGHVAVAADGSSLVWSPSYDKAPRPVSYSKDRGATWMASAGIPNGARVSSDRVNPAKFYGIADGKFYLSTDGGANFRVTQAAGLPTQLTSNFKAMPGVEGDIWIAAAGDNKNSTGVFGLWHSVDSGTSFKRLDQVQEAATIGFGKAAPGKKTMALYSYASINNKFGIYRSDDFGQSWIRINDDQHQFGAANVTITGDPRVYGRVYVGTNGLGIVIGNPSGKSTEKDNKPPKIDMISKSGLVHEETYVLSGKVNEDLENGEVTVNFNGGGPEQIAVVNGIFTKAFTLAEGKNNFEITAVDLAGNRSVKKLTVQYKIRKK